MPRRRLHEPAAGVPRGRRASSRGFRYLLAPRPGRPDVSCCGRRWAAKIAWFAEPRSDEAELSGVRAACELLGSKLPSEMPDRGHLRRRSGTFCCFRKRLRVSNSSTEGPKGGCIDRSSVEGAVQLRGRGTTPEGSRGEGAVLLPGGHLLVAKEKETAALIEFGPPNSPSRGLARGGALADGKRWPIKKGHDRFVALADLASRQDTGQDLCRLQ